METFWRVSCSAQLIHSCCLCQSIYGVYCTVSKHTSHSPTTIWTNSQPIFQSVPSGVTSIHFFSCGPDTQYRNKIIFFILISILQQRIPTIQIFFVKISRDRTQQRYAGWWVATCKRTTDSVVAAGVDIDNLIDILKQRCNGIIFFSSSNEDI